MKTTLWFVKYHAARTIPAVLLLLALCALTAHSASAQRVAPRGEVLPAAPPATGYAAPPLNCSVSVNGQDVTIDKEHSSVAGSSVICNYVAKTQGKNPAVSGFAVTVEYFCDQDTQAAWQSKTSPQAKYQPGTNPNGEVLRSAGVVIIREDGEVSGFAGTFTVAEKMFVLFQPREIATVVVHTDVKQPDAPPSGPAPNPDPLVLNLKADQLIEAAGAVARAHLAIESTLNCSPAPTTVPVDPTLPGKAPVLAKIAAIDGVTVGITSKFANGNTYQRVDVRNGTELNYGDQICFRGSGRLVLTWYDGSIVTLDDPESFSGRGGATLCIEINLKQPNLHSGIIPNAAAYLMEKISGAANSMLQVNINAANDPPEVKDESVKLDVHGTIYMVGRDMAKGASVVCAKQGVVGVTPLNTSLAPFDLRAGSQVEVSDTAVGPITPGCTLPKNGPVQQPDSSAVGMTLQAARRTVIAGSTVIVPVWLINADKLANLNFALAYDPSVVQTAGDPVKGDLLDNTLFKANAGQAGSILAGLAQTSPLQGTGTVVNIPFRATGQPGAVTELLLSVTSINDPSGGVLNINRIMGEIVIAGPDGKVPSGPGSNAGSAPGPDDLQKGDCDGDGFLTELDALCALEMSVQSRPADLLMDIDQSGAVDSRDAVIILQKALNK